MNKTIEIPGFYSTPGLMTDFREASPLAAGLPNDVQRLCAVIHGWFMHVFWAPALEYKPEERQATDIRLRDAESLVRLLSERDATPLTESREFTQRIVTECRTTASC